jgi:hypothetical protein
MNRHVNRWAVAAMLAMVVGCGDPAALELLTVARQAVAEARSDLAIDRDEYHARMALQFRMLDSAFDADVRLVGAGGITSAEGTPATLNPEWIISARKGYAVARDATVQQMLVAEANYAIRQDNLLAADEAIDQAGRLMLKWSLLSDDIQRTLIQSQEELIDAE